MRSGVVRRLTVRKVVRRDGRRSIVRRRVRVLKRSVVVRLGRTTRIDGRLTNGGGDAIAGAEVQVLTAVDGGTEQLVGVLRTDENGSYAYTASGSASRTLRFFYPGSPLILPAGSKVALRVPATSSLRVDRRHVLNGESVVFSGRVRSLPIPATGKLVQVEVLLSGGWQTFRTARTDANGRWRVRYRFGRTGATQWYRFRVQLPREAGYPFATGASRSIRVRVRGGS